jgi:metal-responsive CopG/Arc/MetJ family transcriptional regulator
MPDDLVAEIDDRRHSTTDRSEWIRDAVIARLNAEDAGEWKDPDDRYTPAEA